MSEVVTGVGVLSVGVMKSSYPEGDPMVGMEAMGEVFTYVLTGTSIH